MSSIVGKLVKGNTNLGKFAMGFVVIVFTVAAWAVLTLSGYQFPVYSSPISPNFYQDVMKYSAVFIFGIIGAICIYCIKRDERKGMKGGGFDVPITYGGY